MEMNITTEEKIIQIIRLQHQMDELDKSISELKESVMADMDLAGVKSLDTNEANVTKISKMNYSYVDESAIMAYLKANGLDNYLETKIRKTDLNKELSKKGSLCESLSGKFSTSETPYLKIKEKASL